MTSTIGRYVARLLLGRFALVLLGLAALLLLLEFLADSDQVIAVSDEAARTLALYMALRLPDILAQLIPVAALLAGLLTFAELGRHSELTAIYAGGLSKIRLALAIMPVVVLVGGFQLLIEDQARPAALAELRTWGVGELGSGDEAPVTWLRLGQEILRVRKIDPRQAELRGVTIFERDQEGNLIAKTEAERAVAEGDAWMLHDVARSRVGSAVVDRSERMRWGGDLAPRDLDVLIASPSEMPLADLLRVLRQPELGNQPNYRYETALHERLAGPLTTAMLLFLTVALARPPHGRATHTALVAGGLGGGFLLWTFDGLVSNFGHLGLVPPALAGWAPVAVIAAIVASIVVHDHGSRRASHGAGARAAQPAH
jgi:lipopolysaccharide export system permease protein